MLSDDRRELVSHATSAASSHNTQPWRFRLEERAISILPDFNRRCSIVDPDDHHLFVSLGCALENLLVAAEAMGLRGEHTFDASAGRESIRVSLAAASPASSPLFDAMLHRQCTRAAYDGHAVAADVLRQLEAAASGNGVSVLVLTDKPRIESVLEYVTRGNAAQINDSAWLEELTTWSRFNSNEALRSGDGLSAAATGNPEVPRWLGKLYMSRAFTAKYQNDKDAKHVRSSSGILVFVSEHDDKAHWVEVGRCYERFALQATALGLRNAFMNQPLEVGSLRQEFAAWLGLGSRRPDLIVRFGSGPEMPRSFRRPVEELID